MEKNKNPKKEIDLKNYQDLNGLTLKKMNFGLWLAENRRRLLWALTIVLVLLSAGFFIYSSYYYILYFLSGQKDVSLLDNQIVYPRKPTEDLKVAPVQVLAVGDRSDLAVQVENINLKFSVSLSYCFVQGDGQEIACQSSFVLPGQQKYFLAFNQDLSAVSGRPTLKIKDIFWQRLNAHDVPDWPSFAQARLNFAIKNLTFNNQSRSGLSDKIFLNNLQFDVVNQSPYGYYEVPLNILLYSGSELVSVQRYFLSNLLADEERHVDISWPGSLPSTIRTEVQPDINILDSQVYLKYQGASQ